MTLPLPIFARQLVLLLCGPHWLAAGCCLALHSLCGFVTADDAVTTHYVPPALNPPSASFVQLASLASSCRLKRRHFENRAWRQSPADANWIMDMPWTPFIAYLTIIYSKTIQYNTFQVKREKEALSEQCFQIYLTSFQGGAY